MSAAFLSDQRVGVRSELYSFVVIVDTEPVLRCTVRRDAFRYAVLVRQALRQADRFDLDAAPAPAKRRLRSRSKLRR